MGQSIANESLDFLSKKARQFGDDFAALFSEYGINAPVNGRSIADAIVQHGKEFATDVHNIITKQVQYDGFGEKIKGFAQKTGGIINRYNEKRDERKNATQQPAEQAQIVKVAAPEKPKDDKINLENPLLIGVGAVLLIVIIILIVKAAN